MPKRATKRTPAKKKQTRGVFVADEETIRRRAYELYLERGGTEGDATNDWLRAEHELLRGRKRAK
jgi:hypothetical protein